MYSVLVCVQVLRNSGVITDSEWDVFLHGGTLKLMSSMSLKFYFEDFVSLLFIPCKDSFFKTRCLFDFLTPDKMFYGFCLKSRKNYDMIFII